MKKFTVSMLIALLGAGFVTACGSDSDDDEKENASCTLSCDGPTAEGVQATLDSENCKCVLSCKADYDKVEDASTENGFKCEKKEGDNEGSEQTDPCKDKCPATLATGLVCNATADTTASDGCKVEYSCATGFDKKDDDSTIGFSCEAAKLANGKVCNGHDECLSEYCDLVDDETGVCGDEPTTPVIDPSKTCSDDAGCASIEGALCVKGQCRTLSEVDKELDCSIDRDLGYCFGNVRVYCYSTDFASMFTSQDCKENTCEVDAHEGAICKKETVDPGECVAANENNKLYECTGSQAEDEGSYIAYIIKTCTNNNGTYEWVSETKNCSGADACWENHPSKGCISTIPNDFENGQDCYIDINCKSDYCDPETKKCVDKP